MPEWGRPECARPANLQLVYRQVSSSTRVASAIDRAARPPLRRTRVAGDRREKAQHSGRSRCGVAGVTKSSPKSFSSRRCWLGLVRDALAGRPVVRSTELMSFVLSSRGLLLLFLAAAVATAEVGRVFPPSLES